MNIQLSRNQIQQQLAEYLNINTIKTIKELQDAKNNKKQPQTAIQIKKQTPEFFSISKQDEVTINLDDFKFEPQRRQKSWRSQLKEAEQTQQPIYHQAYGYCLEQFKFDSLMERLQLLRKSIFKKKIPNGEIYQIEEFIPLQILKRIAMDLPLNISDMNAILQDHQITESFLKEIKYFVKQQNIDKNTIFYHPKMYEQNDDQLHQLLTEFVGLNKKRSSESQEQASMVSSTQLKC